MKHYDSKKQKNSCSIIKTAVLSSHLTTISIPCPSFLPFVLSSLETKRVVVLVDSFNFSEVVSFFNIYSNSFAAFAKTSKTTTPLNILNFKNLVVALSRSRTSLGWEKIKQCFIERDLLSVPLFSINIKKNYIINNQTSQESLLSQLKKYKYCLKKEVSFLGDYSVRGGIIDIFSYSGNHPLRVSFLHAKAQIYVFNIGSGLIIKKTTRGLLTPVFSKQKKETVSGLLKKGDLVVDYVKNKIIIQNCLQKNKTKKNITLKTIQYLDYKKIKKHGYFSKFLSMSGCLVVGGGSFFPVWFLKKQPFFAPSSLHLNSFNIGDYYIHDNFGVCVFVGVESSVDSSLVRVCLKFDDGLIRLDVSRLGLLSFLDVSEAKITLDKIGSSGRWRKRKNSYTLKAEAYVLGLIQTYKARKTAVRPGCVVDFDLNSLLASFFPHQETIDQNLCIKEIFKDLCSPSPMNRLLCGDVGFGKTEIALRSAFLSLYNNRRVLVLAPTTILANQLYDCFFSRLSVFGVSCGLVLGSKDNASCFRVFLKTQGSLLVGTHALLNNDSVLSACDYLIVDEEHRFGIKDKELVLSKNPLCDILFMSATPLPRTLQFSLSKIRNISTIKTPPLSKKEIITDVVFYNKPLLLLIIKNELSRGGLVYVVENSVNNVKKTFKYLSGCLPPSSVRFLYSGLGNNQINTIMCDFRLGLFSVLVSTSIVESGVDIGGVNTIIVNNSHCFGLSQLHQLRGRVGRSTKQAFAFFMVPVKKTLSSVALNRLKVIKNNISLGSGHIIALNDLKQRGPGFLLGYKQSGRIPVGFEFYSKLVSSFLNKQSLLPKVTLAVGVLPADLFLTSSDLINYYKAYDECFSLDCVLRLRSRLVSLFGSLPYHFKPFLKDKQTAVLIKDSIISSVVLKNSFVEISLRCSFSVFMSCWDVSVSSLFKSFSTPYSFLRALGGVKIQYKKTGKDDYILVESLGEILYEK